VTDRRALLVDVAELVELLAGASRPTLLDVRWKLGGPPGRETYEAGHIPGAVFADLDADLAAPPGPGGRHPLPDPEELTAAMRRLGVRQARPVVVYDDAGGVVAARAWWDLAHFGHDDVRLLDGGFDAWVAAGLPVRTGPSPSVPAGDFTAGAGRLAVVDATGAAQVAVHGALLDARAPERYRGEVEPVDPAAGHVPGAVSVPTAGLLVDGRFPEAAVLRERFVSAGVRDGAPVAAYCGSGVNAAHEVLALRLAGFDDAALYAGSWSEWSADPARPVATGAQPRPA
jgi:thiosulfate/3-mercaptopyruvate sulfurtransferase